MKEGETKNIKEEQKWLEKRKQADVESKHIKKKQKQPEMKKEK